MNYLKLTIYGTEYAFPNAEKVKENLFGTLILEKLDEKTTRITGDRIAGDVDMCIDKLIGIISSDILQEFIDVLVSMGIASTTIISVMTNK